MSAEHVVLLVEDDQDIRTFVRDALQDEGYSVTTAADGEIAIAMLHEHQPPPEHLCLVILDMMLPGASGMTVLQTLRTLGNYVPVLAMSADRGQLRRALDAGVKGLLPKPFNLDMLLAVVERTCSH